MADAKSFLGSLFDFSFKTFITGSIIKVLFGISVLGAAILSIFLIVSSFALNRGPLGVFMLLIGAPLVFLITVIYARVFLELIIVIFRISENTAEIAQQNKPVDTALDDEKPLFCQNCGAKVDNPSAPCPNCGAVL